MTSAAHRHDLMEAIHEDRVTEVAAGLSGDPLADEITAVCARIGADNEGEGRRLVDLLTAAGVSVSPSPGSTPSQRHSVELLVDDAASARRAAEVLVGEGLVAWHPLVGGAWEIHRRQGDRVTASGGSEPGFAVSIRWPPTSSAPGVPSALRPRRSDWELIDLPGSLWPLYYLVRPARLGLERMGVVARRGPWLGPPLGTPAELIPPLLDVAAVGSDDVLVDLGCGDGRLVIEAARSRGCRAIGVELDPVLAGRARAAVEAAGLSESVEVVEGDADKVSLTDATTVFLFLPAEVVGAVVTRLLATLRGGARIVAHEQRRLEDVPPTNRQELLVAPRALTVAHQWLVSRPD